MARAKHESANSDANVGYRQGFQGSSNVRPLTDGSSQDINDWLDLLARIGHDLRTPLNAVIGFSDAMQNELHGPLGHSRYQEYVQHIRTSGSQLLKAAEDTLAMTELLATSPATRQADVSLAVILDNVLEDFHSCAAQPSADIVSSIDPTLMVRGDPKMLPKAICHLLASAASVAASDARISIDAHVVQGHVGFSIQVRRCEAGACLPTDSEQSSSAEETGIGRDNLSLCLARTLFELHDCPIVIDASGPGLMMKTRLEQALQRDFFA